MKRYTEEHSNALYHLQFEGSSQVRIKTSFPVKGDRKPWNVTITHQDDSTDSKHMFCEVWTQSICGVQKLAIFLLTQHFIFFP